MMFKKKQGIAIIWLGVLVTIFIIGLLYVVFSYVIYGNLTPAIYPALNALDNSSGINVTALHHTIDLINLVWLTFPLMMMFAVILYGFMASQRRGYETSYGG